MTDNLDVFDAFDKVDYAISLYDGKGKLLDINQAAMKIYGFSDKESLFASDNYFQSNPNYRDFMDLNQLAIKDATFKFIYDCDKFNALHPGLSSRSGKFLLSLRIHPIYDDGCRLKYVMMFSVDLTAMKPQRKSISHFMDTRPFMMNAGGISTWVYDLVSGKRILDYGSHLFPSLETMDEFMALVHPSDVTSLQNLIGLIRYGNKIEGNVKFRISSVSEDEIYITLDAFLMPYSEEGRVVSIYFLTKDVTKQEQYQKDLMVKEHLLSQTIKEYQDSNMLLHTLIDRMPSLFFVKDIDKDFKYVMVNELFCKRVGLRSDMIIGHTDFEILKNKKEAERFRKIDKDTIKSGSVLIREEHTLDGKKHVWQTSKYHMVTNKGRKLIIGLSQDITKLDRAYQEIKESKEKAEKADELKTAFLRNITHEIRTPLNLIMGFSEMIIDASTDEEKRNCRHVIEENGDALTAIFDDILNLSQMQAGCFSTIKESFDLAEFILKLQYEFASKTKKGVVLEVQIPETHRAVKLDRYHLNQIMHKFIGNAIKYTDSGKIVIGYEYSDKGVYVYVEDTGIGINTDEQVKIFDHFEKVDNNIQGAGLGLTICKMLIEHLGGKINVRSTKGVGSRFCVWLPL